jgi:hypothetical protein
MQYYAVYVDNCKTPVARFATKEEADKYVATRLEWHRLRQVARDEGQPGNIYDADGNLIGRKDISDREFLAPLLDED